MVVIIPVALLPCRQVLQNQSHQTKAAKTKGPHKVGLWLHSPEGL
jgi:hypothetical protein